MSHPGESRGFHHFNRVKLLNKQDKNQISNAILLIEQMLPITKILFGRISEDLDKNHKSGEE